MRIYKIDGYCDCTISQTDTEKAHKNKNKTQASDKKILE